MTRPWSVEFYEDEEGHVPVQAFLDGLDPKRRAKLLALIALLKEQGPTLPYPYSSQVRSKLRELRGHRGAEHYRVLYFGGPTRSFVLLHAFAKHTDTTPERDIAIAEQRMADHVKRRTRRA